MKLWTWIVEKILTAKNQKRAIEQIGRALTKLREKQNKSGEVVVTMLIVAALGMVLGSALSSGVNTRSIVHRSQITITGDSNLVHVCFGSNVVDVSGSGGVSVPMVGGK